MPLYEYLCEKCNKLSEFMQKMDEAAMVKCPHCLADSLKKVISKTSFTLKGTGWYATDYKPSKASPAPTSELTTPKPAEPKEDKKNTPPT